MRESAGLVNNVVGEANFSSPLLTGPRSLRMPIGRQPTAAVIYGCGCCGTII